MPEHALLIVDDEPANLAVLTQLLQPHYRVRAVNSGPLTLEEWTIMKTHAKIGAEAIDRAEADIEATVDFLVLAKEIAHWHHDHADEVP